MPIYRLGKDTGFPPAELAEDEGLLAVGGDLSPERLLNAYAGGIFPWYSEDEPILWFSPDPRMVLFPEKFKLRDSLRRVLQSGRFEVKLDTDFPSVIAKCATKSRPGQDGTWITAEMQEAYCHMHELGFAHSFETYCDGQLVGGLYGISLGNAFFGESMFHDERDASKVAFASLVTFAREMGFDLIDAQQPTSHLKSLGAEEIDRADFLQILSKCLEKETLRGKWTDYRPNQAKPTADSA